MYLKKISVLNYKNIESLDLEFSPKINCFVGRNGIGKTNLLDAVYYLSFCKSYSNPLDVQVMRHNSDSFMLQGYYSRLGQEETILTSVRRGRKKIFQHNKTDYPRLVDHLGFLPIVMISPDDVELILGGSETRRKFMDTFISQYDKPYVLALLRYNEALKNRNALLKQEAEPDALTLELYEEQLAQEMAYIFSRRTNFVTGFMPVFQKYFQLISAGHETVSLVYQSHGQQGDLMLLLKEVRQRDRILGYTTRGAHKDDLVMDLGLYPLKRTGSQGQIKTFLVALKLAQYVFLHEVKGVRPILLLDDVFDKLDAERVKRILEIVSTEDFGQIFITDTNRAHLDLMLQEVAGEHKIFDIETLI